MCISSTPSMPTPPPPPAPPKDPPKKTDPAVKKARTDERTKAALASGRDGTILTGASGLNAPANTAKKVLLGQ